MQDYAATKKGNIATYMGAEMQINWDVAYNYIIFAVAMMLYGELRAFISRRLYDRHQWKHHLPDEYKYNLEERDQTIKDLKHKLEISEHNNKHLDRSFASMIKIGLENLRR